MEPSVTARASGRYTRIASPLHTILVLAVEAVLAIRGMIRADQMRAAVNVDRIQFYDRTLFSQWLMFALVILGVRLSGSPLAIVLGDRWRSAGELLRDIGIAAGFLIASVMLGSIIGSHSHASSRDSPVQFLFPHGSLEIALWIALSITAGICEETIYRGYLQRQFMALTKNAPSGIILSATVFAAAHAYQGLGLAIQIGLLGAMSGILAHWRKSVRPGMIAHASQDILGGLLAGVVKH